MSPRAPPSPDPHPPKRARQSSPDRASPTSGPSVAGPVSPVAEHSHDGAAGSGSKVGPSSSFRNVSACNRCRLRKNRCDQKLPSCESCKKARVACVGYDPITKREIPRSYVFYLETRVDQLEALLRANSIQYPPADDLEYCSKPGADAGLSKSPTDGGQSVLSDAASRTAPARSQNDESNPAKTKLAKHSGGSGSRSLAQTNGVSFARVVFAAVQSSVSDQRSNSEKAGVRPYRPIAGNGVLAPGTSMRDSFFGLHTRPTISPADFPNKDLASRLVHLYFEHANPQIPVLHRVDFMQMFELAYADEGRIRGPRELYMLNMVFAIGGGIIMDEKATKAEDDRKPRQAQPEEYHASAIVHLEACLSSSGGGLEELQAVLLLANFALLRPVAPGLWYIVGVAVRLAVDLGLHYEDGKESGRPGPTSESTADYNKAREIQAKERGRREYIRDLRRRLWWCTYSFDRLVSTCVGRPFGVSDQVVTTEFPSLYEDRYITPAGLVEPSGPEPTYKVVAQHYFRLRLLQSEILQVLQYQHAQIARSRGQNNSNIYMHSQLPSPFLNRFETFRLWRMDIDRRLYEWKNSAPDKEDSGVLFSVEFLELNYWQAIIMLYRQSLDVPAIFQGEYHTSKEVNSPSHYHSEDREDEERVYVKVAEAGQRIIRIYRQLHVVGLVNYTYLATHHLFMAGISYLYAIWYSPIVRSRLTMDEVDFTILAATSVFSDLVDKCPPAEACRDAFDRTAKTTLRMANSTGGFGGGRAGSVRGSKGHHERSDYMSARDVTANRHKHQPRPSSDLPRSSSQYDMSGVEAYPSSHPAGHLPPLQTTPFRLSMPNVKSENDSFSMLRGIAASNLSNTTNSDVNMTPDNSSIDPVLLPSPSAAPMQSPISVTSMTPVSSNAPPLPQSGPAAGINYLQSPSGSYTPGAMSYSDLQGMDLLQGLQNSTGMDGEISSDAMDLGLGLGWEGMHHDFSDGQQIDLFEGFFFGGQQGGGGNGGGI